MYPRSADTCLTRTVINWLSSPVITDNVNKHHIFGDYFTSKSCETTRPQLSPRQRLSQQDGAEYWAVRKKDENRLHVVEMCMLQWIRGNTRKDQVRKQILHEYAMTYMDSWIQSTDHSVVKNL